MTAARQAYAVWELTLACNLACAHCGSRAGTQREGELSTDEALDLVRQLAEVGITEVTLIGGEAFLRRDWLVIAAEITRRGMACTVTTGGFRLSRGMAERMRAAGIGQASVSVDGLEATHDRLRGKAGSWQSCWAAIGHLRGAGLRATCNTQVNQLTAPELLPLYELLVGAGVDAWQVQLTVPMGNAADNAGLLLQPSDLLEVFPVLAEIARRGKKDGLLLFPGNNVGYYGPYETLLQGAWQSGRWQGCQAGLATLGIEADGTIKGCPSLPTAAYAGGNIRERSLADIVRSAPELNFNMSARTPEGTAHLWGFCAECEHAAACRGGCSWTAHTFFGRRGNNPYCHHRALVKQRQGLRERLELVEPAAGRPFDHGVFRIIEEPA
jgi:radical SAM protein with 4Fe4S-binding SPASM domain